MIALDTPALAPVSPVPPVRLVDENGPPGSASQLRGLARALRARWRLVAGSIAAGVALMSIVTLLTERRYTATAVVQVENDAPRVTKIDQVVAGPSYLESVEYFQNQVNLLKSRTLIAAVIREVGIEQDARFRERPPGLVGRAFGALVRAIGRLGASPATPGGPTEADGVPSAIIDHYAANLLVKPIPNSRLIQIRVRARDPGLAQAVANAHAGEYIRRTLQSKFELTGAARDYLEKELQRVRREVTTSEQALATFRRTNNIVVAEETEGNASLERLADLSRRLTNAEAQRIELEAQHRLVESRDFEALPAVLQSPLIQTLKGDLARLEAREAELARVFLEGNPELRQVRAQVRTQRGRVQQEVGRAVAGVDSQYLAARATEDALRAEVSRQQEAVLNLKEISGQYVQLDQAVQSNRQLYAALLQRMGETSVVRGVQLSNITVLDPAERPLVPSEPRTVLNLVFGLALGLVFGVAAVAVLENVDTSLKTPADVERCLALPTLGVIPDFRYVGDELGMRRRLVDGRRARTAARLPGRSVAAEVFRTLRTSILFFDPAHPPRTLLVTSSQAGEGKTATAVNLALSLTQLGARVLLIDADLRKPRCHHALGLPERPGLAEHLHGELDLAGAVQTLPAASARHGGAALAFVPSGRLVPDAAELVSSTRMREMLADAAAAYDIVIVDSPPIFPVADASLLATQVDGVVLVVRGSRTPRHVTQEAIARLRFMQAKVLGVVLNAIDPDAGEYPSRYAYYFRDAAGA